MRSEENGALSARWLMVPAGLDVEITSPRGARQSSDGGRSPSERPGGRVRQLPRRAGPGPYDRLAERADVREAVAYLASEAYGIPVTVGGSWAERHWAGGVPLIRTDEWVFTAVLDPEPGRVGGDASRLLAGLLLLFPTEARRERFERGTLLRGKVPAGGWHTDCVPGLETGPGSGPVPSFPYGGRTRLPPAAAGGEDLEGRAAG
ncbi:hypothetical protein ACH5AO_29500 [Streptomyces sp. NPDC018964]|uniref:hypothetical protein n=1 Tax=Streptomyces sp. NPDC018964 TaxID=3365058 RepID=UPI00379E2783